MLVMLPLAAAISGYFNLAIRQGWGFIVAFANGVWAGVLALFFGALLCVAREIVKGFETNTIHSFDGTLSVVSDTVYPLTGYYGSFALLMIVLGSSAAVGVATELLHWVLVLFREKRAGKA